VQSTKIELPSASGLLTNVAGLVLVHSVRETTGTTPAAYRLWDGPSPGGSLVLTVGLNAGASQTNSFGLGNLPFESGLYYELVSGQVEGQVTVAWSRDPDVVVSIAGAVPIHTLADLDEH
jgi:hypothetical protein